MRVIYGPWSRRTPAQPDRRTPRTLEDATLPNIVHEAARLRRRRRWLALLVCASGLGPIFMASKIQVDHYSLREIQDRAGLQRTLVRQVADGVRSLPHLDSAETEYARELRQTITQRIEQALATMNFMISEGSAPPAHASAGLRNAYLGPDGLQGQLRKFLADGIALASRQLPPSIDEAMEFEGSATALMSFVQAAVHAHTAHSRFQDRWLIGLLLASALFPMAVWAVGASAWIRPLHRQVLALAVTTEREARTDDLTGLLNRRAFLRLLDECLRHAEGGNHVGVITVDLDWFKEINSADGHAGGDAVLVEVGKRLRQIARAGDLIARIGGDEFAIAVTGLPEPNMLAAIAERVCDLLSQPVQRQGRLLRLGATVGAALAPPVSENGTNTSWRSAITLLRYADEALSEAKRNGRGTWKLFGEADQQRSERTTTILGSLSRHDPKIRGLRCYLQPVVSLRDGAVLGFEALARWDHPELGALSPCEFVNVAESGGKGMKLGTSLRSLALSCFASLATARALTWPQKPWVAINVSPIDLASEEFVRDLQAALSEHGLSPENIVIEITEDVLLERVSEEARERLMALRGRGAKIVLDDFGTGYSGLKQLMCMPLDGIKLDKSFTQRLGSDPRATGIVRGTVALAHSLGLRVTAEGVETEETLSLLRDLGCDAAQGFLLGRPQPLLNAVEWCHEWPTRAPGLLVQGGREASAIFRPPVQKHGSS